MTWRNSKLFWTALITSAALHLGFYAWLNPSGAPSVVGPAGVVSVDFIEPVSHEVRVMASPRSAKTKKNSRAATTAPPGSRAAAAEATTPVVARGGSAETSALIREITRLINSRKSYPRAALARELEGRVVVAMTLARDGRLLKVEVEEASPYAILNQAALGAVREVQNFPALPISAGETLHLHVPLVYQISRR